jgi:alcohol dehydrogenase
MRAAQFSSYGGPEVIAFNRNADLPKLREGHVMIENRAASINPIDSVIRAGYLKDKLPLTFPTTLAGDFSGEVVELGPGVSGFRKGDQVFGFAPVIVGGSGAAAEYVAANASMVARKPSKGSHAEAAALPLAGVSAVQALENDILAKPGQKILIHGGAGGVGSFSIQYAKHIGCRVATTVRGVQEGFVRGLGADDVINFELQDFATILRDYDAVLDTVGGEVYTKSFNAVRKGGIVASMVQNPPNQDLMSRFGVRSVAVSAQVNTASLNRLAQLVDKGALKAEVGREYPLEETREAYTYFEQDHPNGKIVVGTR